VLYIGGFSALLTLIDNVDVAIIISGAGSTNDSCLGAIPTFSGFGACSKGGSINVFGCCSASYVELIPLL
jgi:hypothetical protein